MSLAVHPGFAATDFLKQGETLGRLQRLKMQIGAHVIPSAADAARSSLRAATDPDARGGEFYGPSGTGGVRGAPVLVRLARRSLDERAQARLWDLSVDVTGVEYVFPTDVV